MNLDYYRSLEFWENGSICKGRWYILLVMFVFKFKINILKNKFYNKFKKLFFNSYLFLFYWKLKFL